MTAPNNQSVKFGTAEVNDTRLYYEIRGSGSELVFIHGGVTDNRIWDGQFQYFSRYFRVMRYDVRCCGKSAKKKSEEYSHADDLYALMGYLNIAKASFVGHSMGGRIALDFSLCYPDSTTSVIAVDSALGGFSWSQEQKFFFQSLADTAKRKGIDAARELYLQNSAFIKPAFRDPQLASRLKFIVRGFEGWGWLYGDPARFPKPPAINRLEQIEAPVLVALGELDTPDMHRIADILGKRIPTARKVTVPDSGHFSYLEKNELFNRIVLDFLDQK